MVGCRPALSARLPNAREDWPTGTHFVLVPSAEEMRRLLGPAEDAIRRRRSAAYFARLQNSARARLPLGMHDRFEEYVFADGMIHARDAAGHARHLPAHLKVVRLPEFFIGAGETWDVTASHMDWGGVHFREELYVLVRVDRLIVEPGSAIAVQGNVLVLDCAQIQMQTVQAGTHPRRKDRFEIRILPTRHPAFSQLQATPGRAGESGPDGADGRDSSATQFVPTPLGAHLMEISQDRQGACGTDGADGKNGTAGQNGGMSMFADIRIGSLAGFKRGSLRVSVQAGMGLPGGAGGSGGNGGAGGNGADGLDGLGELTQGGRGGRGANGGHGGHGGRGGNGGLASDIFVRIPSAHAACLDLVSKESVGGPGSRGGAGGKGGPGGAHGALSNMGAEKKAPAGADGLPGRAGAPGRPRPGPTIHLFADD